MSLEYDILTILQTASLGTIGLDLFAYTMPESPDNCIVVYPNGGYPRDKAGFLQYPTPMIHIRNNYASVAQSKADLVISALHRVANTTINGNWYSGIYARNEAVSLGRDDQQRERLSINFEITRS